MGFISLKQQDPKSVEFKGDYSTEHPVIFALFNKASAEHYETVFERALSLGAYALELDEIGAMLDRTSHDVDGRLMQLKVLFEMRGLRSRIVSEKGEDFEIDLAEVLMSMSEQNSWSDEISKMGSVIGVLPGRGRDSRKVGDITIEVAEFNRRIVVEAKNDKSFPNGDPSGTTKAATTEKSDQGQNYSALANREADIAIFVLDQANAHTSFQGFEAITFIPEQPGFTVLIDKAKGDYSALKTAYALSREILRVWDQGPTDWKPIDLLLKRINRELTRLKALDKSLEKIEKSAKDILSALEAVQTARDDVATSVNTMSQAIELMQIEPLTALEKRAIYLDEALSND
jgi:DNA-binding FrmR family transcriptional regulator